MEHNGFLRLNVCVTDCLAKSRSLLLLLGEIVSCSALDSAYCDTFLCSVVSLSSVEGEIRGSNQSRQLQIVAATWPMETKNDSALYQITSVFLIN